MRMLYKFLYKIYEKMNRSVVYNQGTNTMPINAQKEFLKQFKDPRDDYERSYYKYQCFFEYCYRNRKWLRIIYNVGAMFAYHFIFCLLKRRGRNRGNNTNHYDAVIQNVMRVPNGDVLPDEIRNKYTNVKEIREVSYKDVYLDDAAVEICREMRKRYFWSFYYRTIVTIKLAQFSQYIQEYHPALIAFYSCEREFAGPLQTLLCENEGLRYESFMHGDYIYALCFAFQRYSHYYIWDEHYRRFFSELRCTFPTTVYEPEKLKGIARCIDEHECKYFATYYFSAESRKSAEIVHEVFLKFQEAGLRCKIRPHPRFSDIEMLNQVFAGFYIEDPKQYSLADSITESLYAVGLNTTVLSQAYFSGKTVIIDDLSSKDEYLELKEKEYIMLNRPHTLLSELISSTQNKTFDDSYQFVV